MAVTAGPPVPEAALAAFAADAARGAALVALDFDGVLAPLVDDPATSRPLPAAAAALDRLAVRGVPLALVSGRALDDLVALAAAPAGTLLVGGHGAERGRVTAAGLERTPLRLPPDAAARLERLTADLAGLVAGTTARLEHKPASVVVHTRTATPQDAARVTPAAQALGEAAGATVLTGKDVVELGVVEVSKGDALRALRTELGVRRVLFAGDDVTDERAFAVLGPDDVTIKVGRGPTAARYRLPDPAAVADLLADLVARLAPGVP